MGRPCAAILPILQWQTSGHMKLMGSVQKKQYISYILTSYQKTLITYHMIWCIFKFKRKSGPVTPSNGSISDSPKSIISTLYQFVGQSDVQIILTYSLQSLKTFDCTNSTKCMHFNANGAYRQTWVSVSGLDLKCFFPHLFFRSWLLYNDAAVALAFHPA